MSPIVGPDCRDQNHQKCRGDAWDEAKDQITECQCGCHPVEAPDLVQIASEAIIAHRRGAAELCSTNWICNVCGEAIDSAGSSLEESVAAHQAREVLAALAEAGNSKRRHEPVVIELGEDSDAWIVTGASSSDAILGAIARWQIECIGFQDAVESVIPHLLGARTVFRMDWAWVPSNEVHPDDEALLVSGDDVPAGVATFEGTQVTL